MNQHGVSTTSLFDRLDQQSIRRFLLDRLNGTGDSWQSLTRIAAWALVGLALMGWLLPPAGPSPDELTANAGSEGTTEYARSVTLDRRDQRGFLRVPEDDVFKVAWIGGSTLQEVDLEGDGYRFIPGITRELMTPVDDKPVSVDIYFLQSIRMVDSYVATLDAIASKPDVLIIALNPLIVFNGVALQSWDNLDGKLVEGAVKHLEAVPLALGLISPADALWALAGERLDAVADRWHWGSELSMRRAVGDLLDAPSITDAEDPPTLQRIAQMSLPVDFWLEFGSDEPLAATFDRQLAFLRGSGEAGATLNGYVLGLIADAVVESGIPTLVYVTPVRSDVENEPWVAGRLVAIEHRLEGFVPEFEAPTVRFIPGTIARETGPLIFRDMVHVVTGEPVANTIAAHVCELLRSLGHDARCSTGESGGQ